MFGGAASNPYDDIVAKTTDENLTSENWELILNLCDKVMDEGQEGARNVIAAILKRLAHRNPNVQLYALTLAEALSKNCTIEVHREIASRAFTQGLEKLVADRNAHDKVKSRVLGLIAQWTAEFESDPSLGVMEDCFKTLKAKNFKFETPQEPPPPAVDDEIRRKEEEELQRVLEMSMQDKGGRGQWSQYSLAAGDAGASGSVGGSSTGASRSSLPSNSTITNTTSQSKAYNQPLYQSGYVPARTPSPKSHSPAQTSTFYEPAQAAPSLTSVNNAPTAIAASATASLAAGAIVTRVRALHTFEPTEPGELAFEKGDIIKVVDRGYKDWWRGQLKGRTGIFPVNYVEPLPEPTAAELAKEAEQEAAVFAQAVTVEKLLTMLRALDPAKDNLADNEEIQELYRSSMALRPKIVKLIDKYSQKRADLVSMNETFVRARSIFDRMMEESLARHTGVYDQSSYRPPYVRPDSQANVDYAAPGPQSYGWNPNAYDQKTYSGYPTPPAPYPIPDGTVYPPGQQQPQVPASYIDPNAYAQSTQQKALGYVQPYPAHQQPYGPQGPTPYPAQAQTQPQHSQAVPLQQGSPTRQGQHQQPQHQQQPQQPSQIPQDRLQAGQSFAGGPGHQLSPDEASHPAPQVSVQPQPSFTAGAQGYQPLPEPGATKGYPLQRDPGVGHNVTQAQPSSLQPGSSPETPVQQSGRVQSENQASQGLAQQLPIQTQVQSQSSQPQSQQQSSHSPTAHSEPALAGPPYVYDPSTIYADPNVQAWAQYYAQGGKDPSGAVYFFSVPGMNDNIPGTAVSSAKPDAQQADRRHSLGQLPSPTTRSSVPATYDAGDDMQEPGVSGAPPQSHNQSQASTVAPVASFSTPSWVLPRHSSASSDSTHTPSDLTAGSQVPSQPELRNAFQGAAYGQYSGPPQQQFAGLSLSESGPGVGA